MMNFKHTPELAGTLTAYDFPDTSVSMYLGDNVDPTMEGYVTFNNAFWRYEDMYRWIVVYTEHLGYFVFRMENVIDFGGQEEPNKTLDTDP